MMDHWQAAGPASPLQTTAIGGGHSLPGSPPVSPSVTGVQKTPRYPAKIQHKMNQRASPTSSHSPTECRSPPSGGGPVRSPLFNQGSQNSPNSIEMNSPNSINSPVNNNYLLSHNQSDYKQNSFDAPLESTSVISRPQPIEPSCLQSLPALPHFKKGSIIELGEKSLKRIEDITAADLLNSVPTDSQERISYGFISHIQLLPDNLHMEVSIECPAAAAVTSSCPMRSSTSIDQPFLLQNSGWASLHPELTLHRYGLKCEKLCIGSSVLVASRVDNPTESNLPNNNQPASIDDSGVEKPPPPPPVANSLTRKISSGNILDSAAAAVGSAFTPMSGGSPSRLGRKRVLEYDLGPPDSSGQPTYGVKSEKV